MNTPKILSDEFFNSTTRPAGTHEEWLLRMHARLLHREATVRMKEERLEHEKRPECKQEKVVSSENCLSSTSPCMETDI